MNAYLDILCTEQRIVLRCLKIIAHKHPYSNESMDIFNAIAKEYHIDVSYTEMSNLPLEVE